MIQNRAKMFVSIAGIFILLAIIFFVIAGNKASENSTERVDTQLLDYIEKTVCLPASASNRTTVCAAKVIGDDRNHLYLYVYKAEYYYQDQKLSRIGVEMVPLSLEIERSGDEIDIIGHALPAEGAQYGSSMRDIFPNSIIEKISLLTQDDFAHIEALADDRAKLMLDYGHSGNILVDDFYN